MAAKTRILFSVIEVIPDEGEPCCQLDWHPDLSEALDRLSPNGEITDRIIEIAEELLCASDECEDEAEIGAA